MRQPCPSRLLERVAAWASERPEAAAVSVGAEVLPYAELLSRATALSKGLEALGAGPERYVALSGERSVWTIAAILGVLQSGAGFLILDERLPSGRLAKALEAARPILALADGGFARRLRALGVPTRTVSEAMAMASNRSPAPRQGRPENAAYVVMTSGSTGTPKGVVVERRHLDSYVEVAIRRLGVDAPADFASVSPLWTDLGHTAIFGALWSGGRLDLIPEQVATSPSALAARFASQPSDYLKVTPSHLQALLESEPAARILPRRGVILGGERLHWALTQRLKELAPTVQVFNHYGPAECTVGVATGRVPTEPVPGTQTVPIGQPLDGTTMLVLNDDLEPVPAGEVGEIYITGPTVARGYLDDEGATTRQFLDLHVGDLSGRFYRSGDLGRALPDRQLEIVGRVDRQVKVRGFRVEPAEVEHELLADSLIRQVYAMGFEPRPGFVELVAFVVPAPAARISEKELMTALRDRLPVAALPSRLLMVEELPRTDATKVDERVLVSWLSSPPAEAHEAAAQTPTEQIISDLWTSLLGHRIGRDDNVFDHGANSIAAIRFLARMHQTLQLEVPLHVVFEQPTIAEFAQVVEGA
jgi:amino acid adenylation domain-containing protein